MLRTSNPALNDNLFRGADSRLDSGSGVMTIQGTVTKCYLLVGILVAAGLYTWNQAASGNAAVMGWITGGALVGLGCALVLMFARSLAPFLAPAYAVAEGVVLGGLSYVFEMRYPGIAGQAITLTVGTLLGLLTAYRTGLIKPSENFKLGVFAATGGIALFYLGTWIASFFGVHMSFLHDSSPLGIAFSGLLVLLAAFNLVLDFDFIEEGARRGLPKNTEWIAAFGLLVTLVWLYVELLRLLARLQDRRN
ncbi:MAG: Bax inhibitor-1/YccA family protein [Planctomycetota bacterium]